MTLQGDVPTDGKSSLQIGKFCFIDEDVLIKPTLIKKWVVIIFIIYIASFCFGFQYTNQSRLSNLYKASKIGSYTIIGCKSKIQSLNIGNRVQIGSRCNLGNNCIIYDCVIIEDDVEIQENEVIPPFSHVIKTGISNGNYGIHYNNHKILELPESFKKILEINSKISHVNNQFIPSSIP